MVFSGEKCVVGQACVPCTFREMAPVPKDRSVVQEVKHPLMGWHVFQCNLPLALIVWLLVTAVRALHADEVGVIDWHHKLIGTPLESSTFLHKPVAGSGALAFTLTDRNVVAALSLRDGLIGMLLMFRANCSLEAID